MAYTGDGSGKRLGEHIYWGRSTHDLDDAIRAAVDNIPVEVVEQRQATQEDVGEERGAKFVVTSITVEVVGDPNVGAYSVTVE